MIATDDLRLGTQGEPAELMMQHAFDMYAAGVEDLERKPAIYMLTRGLDREIARRSHRSAMKISAQLAHIAIERDPTII